MFEQDPSYLDKVAYFINDHRHHLKDAIFDRYKKVKQVTSRPQDDSVTLQELLQQALSCGLSKESLYDLIVGDISLVSI